MTITTGHLCCGAGGDILGSKAAGAIPLWAIDKDEDAISSVHINHPDIPFIYVGDLNQIDFSNKRFAADIVISGIPCQPFTKIGRRLKDKDERDISVAVAEAIIKIRPNYIIFENVKDYKGEKGFIFLNKRLAQYGIEWRTLNVADYGVPQKRQRLFGLGSLAHVQRLKFPESTHTEDPGLFDQRAAWLKFKTIKDRQDMKPLSAKALRGVLRRLRKHSENGRGFSIQIIDECDMMFTILGTMCRGSGTGSHSTLIWDDGKIRNVSFIEARRAQGFPDDYIFCGKGKAPWLQVANAIPPTIAEQFIRGLKNLVAAT